MPHYDNNRIYYDTFSYTDFSVASTGTTILADNEIEDHFMVIGAFMRVTTPFSGGGATSINAEVGITNGAACDEILASQGVMGLLYKSDFGTYWAGADPKHIVLTTSNNVYIRLESDVNLNALTAGELELYVVYCKHEG